MAYPAYSRKCVLLDWAEIALNVIFHELGCIAGRKEQNFNEYYYQQMYTKGIRHLHAIFISVLEGT